MANTSSHPTGPNHLSDMDKDKPKIDNKRTLSQNRALHLYFTLVATSLNAAGIEIKASLPDMEIPWSPETVKILLWKTVQRILVQKEHTADLSTKEIDLVYDVVNRHLASLGIHEAFPSIETLMLINPSKSDTIS